MTNTNQVVIPTTTFPSTWDWSWQTTQPSPGQSWVNVSREELKLMIKQAVMEMFAEVLGMEE